MNSSHAALALATVAALGLPGNASASANHYGLTISTDTTSNVVFSNGVFTATADHANLNVYDLSNALTNGNVKVTTDNGAGGDEKGDLHVETAFSWSGSNALTLDAFHTIFVDQPVLDNGQGGLTLTNNDGGTDGLLLFGSNSNITFEHLSTPLTINGDVFTLVRHVQSLAGAIAANPDGAYALASNYDASKDGPYSRSPVATTFKGTFEGLGHRISGLDIDYNYRSGRPAGLFSKLGPSGTIRDIGLTHVTITISYGFPDIGALVGENLGQIQNAFADGTVAGDEHNAGGLVGVNSGTVTRSYASVAVGGTAYWSGGLVGENSGTISTSFATGNVATSAVVEGGGLVGYFPDGVIKDCYATGSVSSTADGYRIGGLIGKLGRGSGYPKTQTSYSTGPVPGHSGQQEFAGGVIGLNGGKENSDLYWDTTTSGTDIGVGRGLSAGTSPLTSRQLRSGLPAGFDPAIWKEQAGINNGFPYLIANPPPK